jgi:hypothetical protein
MFRKPPSRRISEEVWRKRDEEIRKLVAAGFYPTAITENIQDDKDGFNPT